jgi:antitoxin HigA-1
VRQSPGQFLRFLLIEEEISAYTAAERTGLSIEQLGAIIAGTIRVTPELAAKLAQLCGTTREMWLNAQHVFDTENSPRQ